MKKVLLLILSFVLCAGAFAKDDSAVPEYQIKGAGAANGGSTLVSVSVMAKKADKVTDDMLMKAAVHGVLFKDYSDSTSAGFGSAASKKAICGSPNAYAEHLDFFEPFFKDGGYKGYAQCVDDTRRVVKVGKQYKVTSTVAVSSSALRKDLEKQGVIKSLKSGW